MALSTLLYLIKFQNSFGINNVRGKVKDQKEKLGNDSIIPMHFAQLMIFN